jgi:hypothetical protein
MERVVKTNDLASQKSIEFQKFVEFLKTKFTITETLLKFLETEVIL